MIRTIRPGSDDAPGRHESSALRAGGRAVGDGAGGPQPDGPQANGPLSGRVALLGAPESGTDVVIDLGRETVTLRSERGTIGAWRLDELTFTFEDEGFQIAVEGERLLLRTSDDDAFAHQVGIVDDREEPSRPRSAGDLFR